MPADPPSNTGSPDRSRPTLSDLSKETTEGDLWNLDEEPLEQAPAKPIQPIQQPATRKPAADEVPHQLSGSSASPVQRGKTPARPAERRSDLPARREDAPAPAGPDDIGELEEIQATPEPEPESVLLVLPEEEPEKPAPASPKRSREPAASRESSATIDTGAKTASNEPRKNRPKQPPATTPKSGGGFRCPKPTKLEWIGLGTFAFILLLGSIWVLSRFFSQLTFESAYTKAPDFPVSGDHATLTSATTFWREPIREGPGRDSANREVAMIPVAEIAIDSEKSVQGVLWLKFRNDKGEIIGDTIKRPFKSGKFDATGDAKITVPATNGFLDEGNFNAYRTSEGRPWTIEIQEGPSFDSASASFKPLTIIPILPLRR